MTTTNTLDISNTVAQCIKIADAGADFVRITAQGVREAEALKDIKQALIQSGYDIPVIADIHFNPAVALIAARHVDKVRINPGNFVDRVGDIDEPVLLQEKLVELLNVCREHNTALRIGVNHGSLSARMFSKYGDTPKGMVESAMEFLQICKSENFADVVVSMKSSNTRVMVYATRLLAKRMRDEGIDYPLHLGVTEAGEGEDGRIKSAVGIGTLLSDGLGDTIRVSLTEEPEREIPVARKLVNVFQKRTEHAAILEVDKGCLSAYGYTKRQSMEAESVPIGGNNPTAVVADLSNVSPIEEKDIKALGFKFDGHEWSSEDGTPDVIYTGLSLINVPTRGLNIIDGEQENVFTCNVEYLTKGFIEYIKENPAVLLILETDNANGVAEQRAFFLKLVELGVMNPVIVRRTYDEPDYEALQLQSAMDFGALLIDGFADGIMLSLAQKSNIVEVVEMAKSLGEDDKVRLVEQKTTFSRNVTSKDLAGTCFGILQAARVRFSKTEYIACPGCGRTLYNLQDTLRRVKLATGHLRGLKIGVMGCIVNGPGEMADADYGYVGAGTGKISLYKGKECVVRNISENKAVDELIGLIRSNGDWIDA
jgi:(E)-4-hydroxy-3-methylbut-2-enyl-diphosphate synthase